MNLIFDKKTLKVISLFDNKLSSKTETAVLKQMFPTNYENLYLWTIEKSFNHNIMCLRVEIDENNYPQALFYKDKEIYRMSNDQKELRYGKKNLVVSGGINLGKKLSDFLISSPYSKDKTVENLSSGVVPYQHAIPALLKGFFKVSTGYASISRNILFRLHNYGIFAKPEHFPSHSNVDPVCLNYLSKYESLKFSRRSKDQVNILILTPLPGMFNGISGKKIIFTMMETETLAADFANGCNQFNEVWVPCRHNRDLFINGGVKVPVHVVPLGVDERFYFKENNAGVNVADGLIPLLGDGLKKFKFISLFQWYPRKCPDILVKSFVKAFNNNDDVCLIIASHHGAPLQIANEVQSYAKSVRDSNHPSIFLYNQIPSDMQLPSVYRFCDAFISTSRGEGFSLPPIEAAACGLPVVSSYHTAMLDYLNEDNAYLVRTTKREVTPPDLVSMCGWYGGQLMNKLGDEEIDQFIIHLRAIVNNYDLALHKAKKLQNIVKNNYTWDITTSLAARRIREG